MPLTAKGTKILNAMEREYGSKKGEQVFYASKNAGKITGVDSAAPDTDVFAALDAISAGCDRLHKRLDALIGKDCP